MKISEVLNQFRVINLKIKYLKSNFTGIDIDFGIKGYNEFLRYTLCNLTNHDIKIANHSINNLFDLYKVFFEIVKKYREAQDSVSEYFLDELFTELQVQKFILTGISIDRYNEEYLYDDIIQRRGEPEFLDSLKNFYNCRVSWLRELRLKIEQQKKILDNVFPEKKKRRNFKNPVSFDSLFRKSEHPKIVKQIFEDNYYTKNGQWTYNGEKNTLATAFYVLSDPEPLGEIHAINPGKISPQLTVFYKEFGLTIAYRAGGNIYTTIRNAKKRRQYDINRAAPYKNFLELFQSLKISS